MFDGTTLKDANSVGGSDKMKKFTAVQLIAAVVLSIGIGLPGTAIADDEPLPEEEDREADPERIQEAQEAFERGASHYYEDEYGRAIVEFRRAHELHPHPLFLHNIARSHQELGRVDRTLAAAERAAAMDEPLSDEVDAANRGLIAGIESLFDAKDVAEDVADRIDDEEIDEIADVESVSRWGGLGWSGVGVAGAGVGTLVGAAVIDRQIEDEWDDYSAAAEGASREEFEEQQQRLASRQTVGRGMLYSGAGLLAVGGGLIVWELVSAPETDRELSIAPALTTPGVDVSVRW